MNYIYEDVWQFGSSSLIDVKTEGTDSSYDNKPLGSHTDGSYMTEPPGLQVFHCLESAEHGGETVLSDGWKIAENIKLMRPRDFDLLCNCPVTFHYVNKQGGQFDLHYSTTDLVFKRCPVNNWVTQLRYNPYDRASTNSMSQSDIHELQTALYNLEQELSCQTFQVKFLLKPGTVMFLDNWRVTHARTDFSGHRIMTGCYVSRDAWRSRARTLGLIL